MAHGSPARRPAPLEGGGQAVHLRVVCPVADGLLLELEGRAVGDSIGLLADVGRERVGGAAELGEDRTQVHHRRLAGASRRPQGLRPPGGAARPQRAAVRLVDLVALRSFSSSAAATNSITEMPDCTQ